MADVGKDPVPIIQKSVKITKKMKKIKILWASTREAYNYMQANNCKCEIITMPPKIIEKISKFGKSFRELTLDTVKTFYKDASEANFKI
jgi:transaldolase